MGPSTLEPSAASLTCDVAVVGAGPAGIAAACQAAESGRRVVLLDEGLAPGGQIWRGGRVPRAPGERLARSGVVVLDRTTVFDVEPGFTLHAERGAGLVRVLAAALVIATGARELFLPFPGWTLPNVFGVGALQALLKSGLSFRGRRVVLAGSGPLLLPVAALLAEDGADVALVAEQAPAASVARFAASLWRAPGKLAAAVRHRLAFASTPYRPGAWVVEATGRGRVEEVVLTDGARAFRERADVLGASFGLVPNVELAALLGCEALAAFVRVDELQRTSVPGVFCAGEPTGIGGVERALLEGEIAGLAAAGREREAARLAPRRRAAHAFAARLALAFAPRPELRRLARPDTIVCRCEDVPLSRLDAGFDPREAKLVTRAGMGPCQGRICQPALEVLFGWPSGAVRPPVKPALVSSLAAEDRHRGAARS